ncbi:myelin-associated neurite-outgrowth inhibitor [Clinocottus analis]|uniref:myelin-associated neurite-outgrowth inhibitor n=1 Tax=Clinocottus analis TaxID=304258 RepID=UPI0035C258AD
MNPVYSPAATGVPFTNTKGMGYPAGFPVGYAAAAPAYTHNIYAGANAAFPSGYAPGTPFKMSCSPNTGTVPPYSTSPNPYPAMYPVRSTYPQQNPYAQALIPSQQQGTYYTQPLYAAPPHVIHHTTVVQPNGMPAAMYQQMPPQRHNSVAMGMVAGTTMAMSAGTLLTTQSPASVNPHQVSMPTYRHPGTPGYSYVPPQW